MIEELTSYDRTTALHSVNLTDTFIKTKDKEFMKYYDRFKDANELGYEKYFFKN